MIMALGTEVGVAHLCQFVGFRIFSWMRAIPVGLVSVTKFLARQAFDLCFSIAQFQPRVHSVSQFLVLAKQLAPTITPCSFPHANL